MTKIPTQESTIHVLKGRFEPHINCEWISPNYFHISIIGLYGQNQVGLGRKNVEELRDLCDEFLSQGSGK